MKNRTFLPLYGKPRRPRKRGRARLFLLGAAVAASGTLAARPAIAAAVATTAQAPANAGQPADTVYTFAIPAGTLDAAIAEIERLTGVRVIVTDQGLRGIGAAGVSGELTLAQAVDRLLAGTSVRAEFPDARTVRLSIGGVAEFVEVTGGPRRAESPKFTQPLRDTPATLVVIPQTVFQDQAATSLRDALRNTPGITLTAGEGGSAPGDNLYIRGFNARGDVYIDGARDNSTLSRDTFNVEAVEVAKGPSSVVTGRGSMGGSVNLVTKSANATNGGSLRLSGGTADNRRVAADVNRRLTDTVAFRLNAMVQDSGVPRRDAVKNESWGLAPSVTFGLGTPTQVTANYQYMNEDNIPDYGLPNGLPALATEQGITVKDLDFSNFYGLVSRDRETGESHVTTVTVQHRFSGRLSLRNLTRYGQNSVERVVTPPRAASAERGGEDPGFNPDVPQIRRTDTKYHFRDNKTIANQTDLTSRFDTGGAGHTLVTGIELMHEKQPTRSMTDRYENGRPPLADFFNPNPEDPYFPSIEPTGATSDGTSNSVGLYAFDTVELGERWQADLGGRWDNASADYDTVSTSGEAAAFSRTDRAFSGRAGLVYKPAERGSIYAAYSSSFSPAFDGNFGLTLGDSGNNDETLPPERTHNIEVGTKWDVRDRLAFTAALFRMEKTNAKTRDESGATVLAGNQRVLGVELGMSGEVAPGLSVFSGISVMDATVEESLNADEVGRQLSYVPKTSFNLWATYRIPVVDLTLGGGAQFTDGYFFNNTNALTSENAAAIQDLTRYWLFSGVATYQLNRYIGIQVNGLNLANARYVDRGYGGHFIPGPGRAVIVSPVITF